MNSSLFLSRRRLFGVAGLLAASGLAAACGASGTGSSAGSSASSARASEADDPTAIATDAYVFGYPLVLMDATRAAAAPANTLLRYTTTPSPDDKIVVTPNVDTLYCQTWLDLSHEPQVIQIPDVKDRYWLAQVMDMWTNTVHDPSSVSPQLAAGAPAGPFTYAVTGPRWSGDLPAGVTRLSVPTDSAWIIVRVALNGANDVPAVVDIENQIRLMPLSRYRTDPTAQTPSSVPQNLTAAPARIVAGMDGTAFFTKLAALLTRYPATQADGAAMTRFASIGIKPGANVAALTASVLDAGATAGKRAIAAYQNPGAKNLNGWVYATNLGTYDTDYQLRANTALTTLAANLPGDSLYPMLNDVPAKPNGYRLHFPAGLLPPAGAFWSITAYTADHFLVPNPDRIYAIGHSPDPVANPDGSVDLTLAPNKPGPQVPEGNWLPVPGNGTFNLAMRIYAPKPAAVSGGWKPPALTPIG
ncbi:DUF1254 domain-containing protein [Tsukamurella soli]|uniref:DUF1254 domain-containing protein n=1 Tax=Tsukamurella soli TaxID=644556 RepID=A0ABP8JHH1_9ACTN